MIPSVAVFTVCAVALVVITLVERRKDPEATVTGMFDRLMTDRAVRVAVLLAWWWLGWHFLAGQTTDTAVPLELAP